VTERASDGRQVAPPSATARAQILAAVASSRSRSSKDGLGLPPGQPSAFIAVCQSDQRAGNGQRVDPCVTEEPAGRRPSTREDVAAPVQSVLPAPLRPDPASDACV